MKCMVYGCNLTLEKVDETKRTIVYECKGGHRVVIPKEK